MRDGRSSGAREAVNRLCFPVVARVPYHQDYLGNNRSSRMATITKRKQIVGLAAWLVVTFLAAAIGGAASIQAGPFYTSCCALAGPRHRRFSGLSGQLCIS